MASWKIARGKRRRSRVDGKRASQVVRFGSTENRGYREYMEDFTFARVSAAPEAAPRGFFVVSLALRGTIFAHSKDKGAVFSVFPNTRLRFSILWDVRVVVGLRRARRG